MYAYLKMQLLGREKNAVDLSELTSVLIPTKINK